MIFGVTKDDSTKKNISRIDCFDAVEDCGCRSNTRMFRGVGCTYRKSELKLGKYANPVWKQRKVCFGRSRTARRSIFATLSYLLRLLNFPFLSAFHNHLLIIRFLFFLDPTPPIPQRNSAPSHFFLPCPRNPHIGGTCSLAALPESLATTSCSTERGRV